MEPRNTAAPLPTHLLDAVRGLAALYVLLAHARIMLFVGWSSAAIVAVPKVLRAAADLTDFAHAAVLAFFLVSGYAIHYRQAHKLAHGDHSLSWRTYAGSRARRLYPPLAAALLITLACDQLGSRLFAPAYADNQTGLTAFVSSMHAETIQAFLGCLLFVQGWLTPIFGTNGPLWSLAFEAFFYVTYPLVLLASRRLGPIICLALFTVVGAASGLAILHGARLAYHPGYQYGFLRQAGGALALLVYWPAWVAGAFLADARAGRVRLPDWLWTGAAIVGPLALAAMAVSLELRQRHDSPLLADPLWVLGFFGPLGWLTAAPHGARVRRWVLRLTQPLLGIGERSYSLYVVHMPVLSVVSAAWFRDHASMPTSLWPAALGVAASLAVAGLVYQVVERHFLSDQRRRLQAAVAPVRPAASTSPGGAGAAGLAGD